MRPQTTIKAICWVFGAIGIAFLLGDIYLLLRGVRILGLVLPFAILGAVFTAIGVVFGMLSGAAARKKRWLLAHGECVDAEIVEVETNGAVSVNGRCPYRLVCKYNEAGVNYICRSENLWNYPERRGNTVRVWRNPNNYRQYYVDAADALVETVEL
ncbi:MAG: hypothetical protein VB092_00645 [Oscillospiraceae bacterium]|nr:hypothetical protein [Oscillospiraceae bacterium]